MLCWASTATAAMDHWAWAAARTWWTNHWPTAHWENWWPSSRAPTRDTSTLWRRWRSACMCLMTPMSSSQSNGSIWCWMLPDWELRRWGRSWRNTVGTWGWRSSNRPVPSHQSRSGAGGNPYHHGEDRAVPSDASHTAETNRRPRWRGNLRSSARSTTATRSASDPPPSCPGHPRSVQPSRSPWSNSLYLPPMILRWESLQLDHLIWIWDRRGGWRTHKYVKSAFQSSNRKNFLIQKVTVGLVLILHGGHCLPIS